MLENLNFCLHTHIRKQQQHTNNTHKIIFQLKLNCILGLTENTCV